MLREQLAVDLFGPGLYVGDQYVGRHAVNRFAGGPGKVDVDGYEQKSFAIFRDFAPVMHMTPEGMVDHLKLIPRQVVQIVKEDPHVLDTYDNFVAATFGPR